VRDKADPPFVPCWRCFTRSLSLTDRAQRMRNPQVSVADVTEVDALFHDAKASAKLLAQSNSQGWLK
jgi:DNA helicase TIP49 (TBP-interacting protein)